MSDSKRLSNAASEPEFDTESTWPEPPLPIVPDLGSPAPFPVDALPAVLRDCAKTLLRTTQAPDGIVCGALLAASSLAAQAHADVALPYGATCPLSLDIVSIADSGERKSAVDKDVLRAHVAFEKDKQDEYQAKLTAYNALSKLDREATDEPRKAVFMPSDITIEGLTKLLATGLPSVGVFSAEGGTFTGGHGMTDESQLRTAAALAKLWDGSPVDRVRAGEGSYKLYGRRVALHLMVQPQSAMNWLGNKTLRDQGLFSRCLVGYPPSTAGTRLFKDEKACDSPHYQAYLQAMDGLLRRPWAVNELGELTPRLLSFDEDAREQWIRLYNEIETSIPTALAPIRALASKAAEHAARIAGVLELVVNPDASFITAESVTSAAKILEWYLGEALRLSAAQPRSESTDRAVLLWDWLTKRGKRLICLAELIQYGPAKLRKAKEMRETMAVLAEHYRVRVSPEPIEWEGRTRNEAWEVRL